MSAQIYSVPDQTEGGRKVFLEWTSIDLSSKLSRTCGGNVNYYKSVHHSIPTRGNRNTMTILKKKISNLSFQLRVQVYSVLGQTGGERKSFFGGCKKGTTS